MQLPDQWHSKPYLCRSLPAMSPGQDDRARSVCNHPIAEENLIEKYQAVDYTGIPYICWGAQVGVPLASYILYMQISIGEDRNVI